MEQQLARFREWRFGLFVHWGLYSLAARHEWVMNRERLTDEQYRPYLDNFEPDLYDPGVWLDAAVEAGMRYTVLTTKHHEGFALWDSAVGDFTVRHTPWGKDLIEPFARAARDRDLGLGFYHSLIDWHHPDFAVDGLHPRRDDDPASIEARDCDQAGYRAFLHTQVEELLTRYGPVDIMWFDFSYPHRIRDGVLTWGGKGRDDWGSDELVAMVRRLQPHVLINDRLDIPGDFVTPEQYQPAQRPTRDGRLVPWEACQTLNGSWGYDRDNVDYKPVDMLIRMLVDTVSKDGNLLLNVGPNGRGELDPRSLESLRGIGRWMRLHNRAIYGAGPSEHVAPPDCRYTQRGDRLYLHLFSWPFRHVHLAGLADKVRYAQFLHDASEVRRHVIKPGEAPQNTKLAGLPAGTLTLELPVRKPDVDVPVIELMLVA